MDTFLKEESKLEEWSINITVGINRQKIVQTRFRGVEHWYLQLEYLMITVCSFQDLMWKHLFVILIFLREVSGASGRWGERGVHRQFYPRFNAAHCHAHPGTRGRGLGDERQTNFKQTAILKGGETAETDGIRYLWKRFILVESRCR